ncbi:FecR family protein [Flavobacterium ajazii]|uniref:FecR family protein n=1 Tax=Flavobacterium ajazii TaxID=2692318 RepID=UPI0013D597A8|nr:FecR domain-containing protein [Flavobacterium ajazii]
MTSEIIYKYLNNEASEHEVQTLFEWIDASEENKRHFIAIKKAWVISSLSEDISAETIPVIQIKAKKKYSVYLKYAAVVFVLLGLGKIALTYTSNQLPKNSKEIVLELGNGQTQYITNKNQKKLVNDKGELIAKKLPGQIVYFGKAKDNELIYNSLKVPYGKTFKLILSDGTIINLNSGTTLRYPEQFGINGKRTVYLTGEAFFEVAKDKEHPFIVNVNEAEIEVLGTKFNVSAYPENPSVNSVLVEGSIQMYETQNTSNSVLLKPNQMATWLNNSKKITTKSVDPSFYSAWTKGELTFKDTPFSTIIKIIQRTYDVEIINKNSDLAKQSFTGSIKISESSVENILELLKRDTPFDYTIEQNKITITNIP